MNMINISVLFQGTHILFTLILMCIPGIVNVAYLDTNRHKYRSIFLDIQ